MRNPSTHFKGIIPPPVLFFILLVSGSMAQMFYSIKIMNGHFLIRLIVGIPMILISGLLAFNALTTIRNNKTDITFKNQTTRVIIDGAFKYTRNPLYLSLLLVMGSLAFCLNTAWLFISLIVLLFLLNFGVVAREERYLEEKFGEEYVLYKKQVRRWI